jgi:hypothetical protein
VSGSDSDDSSPGNSGKVNKDADLDNDGNNGHGNNEGKCDPSNPNADKKGCDASTDDSGSGDDDGSSVGGDDSGSSTEGSDSGGGDVASGSTQRLCGSASPVPSSIEMVRGRSYNASPSDWDGGSADSGWECLRISRAGVQRYQFGYDVGAGTSGGAVEGYTAWARGDLDGDGRTSLFRIRGELIGGSLVHAPAIEVIDPTE